MDPSGSPVQEQIREICSTGPGLELVGLLREGARAGCPVWHSLDGVVVPRLNWTSEGHSPSPLRRELDPILLEAIERSSPRMLASVVEHPKTTTQLKRLTAAVYCDLLGLSEPHAAETLPGYGVEEEHKSSKRRARGLHDVAGEGRRLWSKLGGWPWWCWQPPDGTLPGGWWRDEQIQKALVIWCGDRLPDPLPATPALACQL
jgi:hypothetical protein